MPKLPNAAIAILDLRKVTHYLLDPSHPVGGAKARFFMSFGFTPAKPAELADALVAHGATHEAIALPATPIGVKYQVRGPLDTPSGRRPNVRTVWIIEAGATAPRFVTAVPD